MRSTPTRPTRAARPSIALVSQGMPAYTPGTQRQLLLAAALGLALLANPATPHAQAASTISEGQAQQFDIPSGPLAEVLIRLGDQARVLLIYSSDLVRNRHSPGVQGQRNVRDALDAALANTGLEALPQGQGSYALRERSARGVSQLEQVTVLGTAAQDAHDAAFQGAGTRNILTRDDIERFRGTSVGDIFQGIPGVLVGENRNSGGLDVNIRGMQGQGRVPILVDGARQETTVYRGYSGVASRSYIDPDLIGGISIEKGPTLDAGGTGATGGLVSMRTLEADDIIRDGKDFGMRVRATAIGNNSGSPVASGTPGGYYVGENGSVIGAGTFRTDCKYDCSNDNPLPSSFGSDEGLDRPGPFHPKSWAGSVALAKRFDKLDLVAAYAQREQGNYYAGTHGPTPWIDLSNRRQRGFWTDVTPKIEGATRFRAGERIVNSNFRSQSILLKGNLMLPDDQALQLGVLRYHSEYGELMPSQLIRLGQVRQTDNSTVTAYTYTANYQWSPVDQELLNLKLNLWHTDTDSLNRGFSNDLLTPRLMSVEEKYQRWGTDLSNTMRLSRLGDVELRYGLAMQWENIAPNGEYMLDGETVGDGAPIRDGKRRELSFFTSLSWRPVDSLLLEAGLRHTRFSVHDRRDLDISPDSAYCQDSDGDGLCDPIRNSNRYNGNAPLASLTWEPLQGLQFYARYAEALRMPSLFESTSGFSVAPSLDINLKPERARNREFGINLLTRDALLTDDRLAIKLAYFRNHAQDYLTRTRPNNWEDGAQTNQLFTLRNIESASFHGYELSLAYDGGWFYTQVGGTRYSRIETCQLGSYRRQECTDYGIANSYVNNMIPPKWHASGTLGTRWFDRRLELGVRGTFMGQRSLLPEFNDETALGSLPVVPWHSYRVFDLFASYRVDDQLSVDFNIDNFTDRYYLDALSLGLVPAPGRTARLSLTWQL